MAPKPRTRLLAQADFRRAYAANAVSQLGNAFQFVALMWLAVVAAGPLGVLVVRLLDGLPALLFGLHGGLVADRRDRRRTMIVADLVRGSVLVPVALVAIFGTLPLWTLVGTAFVLTTSASYYTPAFGAFLPSIVGKENVQRANSLVTSANAGLLTSGWALAAVLLDVVSVGTFFAINAASFFASAALLASIGPRSRPVTRAEPPRQRLRRGFTDLRERDGLPIAVGMLAAGMTIMTGVWTIGVAELAHATLGHGAAGLALLLSANAIGAIATTSALSWRPVRRKVLWSCLAWTLAVPGYVLLGLADSLPPALVGTFFVGGASAAAVVLVTAATQESLPEERLGAALGVIFLGHAGTKPLGLVAIAPFYAVFDPTVMFVAGGVALLVLALTAAAAVHLETGRPRSAEPAAAR